MVCLRIRPPYPTVQSSHFFRLAPGYSTTIIGEKTFTRSKTRLTGTAVLLLLWTYWTTSPADPSCLVVALIMVDGTTLQYLTSDSYTQFIGFRDPFVRVVLLLLYTVHS